MATAYARSALIIIIPMADKDGIGFFNDCFKLY
jgi:hypothetical protein